VGFEVEELELEEADREGTARRSRNGEVAQLFDEIADILEIKGEQPYRVNAYRTAARSIGGLKERLEMLFAEGRLRNIRGVGPALEAKIVEFLSTGRLEYYERLTREFPPGLATLLAIPGLGPMRARAIYDQLNVTSVADLERAAREGRLLGVPGFGEKAVHNLLQALERMKERTTRNLISTGWQVAQDTLDALTAQAHPTQVAVVGSVRRMLDTIGNVDLLAAAPGREHELLNVLAGLPNVVEVLGRSDTQARVLVYGGVEVRLHVVPLEAWGGALLWNTGSRAHVEHLAALARKCGWRLSPHGLENDSTGTRLAGDEVEIYARLGLPWIPPEMREDAGEIQAAQAGALPRLVEVSDLRGDLHCHTNWTDGVHSLEEMAHAASAKGYQYMAVTDHSQSLTVARGLTPARLAEERRLVDRVNQKLAPFVVLLGTEMDILRDGRLDFPDDVLGTLDYVSASIHSAFHQPRDVMTARIVRAVSHPRVHTLNHPHGRLIRRREAYSVDMQAVVEAAARSGCALELNAQPDRLDLDGTWAQKAKAAGARFTISSDAHSVRDLNVIRFGVGSARRGWLTAADVLNTRPLEELRVFLKDGES
jgi:DNA polymerase (family X)